MALKKIGEVARETGLTQRTIRFYEEEGLLKPFRTQRGTRLYSDKDIKRLLIIKELRDLGMSIREIKGILSIRNSSETGDEASRKMKNALENLKRHIVKRIKLYESLLREVSSLKEDILRCKECERKPTIEECSKCDIWKFISRHRLSRLIEDYPTTS